MLVFTNVALAPFCLCKDDSTLANGPPKESGMEVMVPGAGAQPWLGAVTPMPVDTEVFTWSTCPFPVVFTCPPVGLGPPQLEVGTGFGPGPPVLSGSADLASLLSSSLESDFFPELDLAAAAAAAAARSCLRNLARRFWNHTCYKSSMKVKFIVCRNRMNQCKCHFTYCTMKKKHDQPLFYGYGKLFNTVIKRF